MRKLTIGKCEGAVADDELGCVYLSEETKGVWKFDAEPDAVSTGTLIAAVGENGLKGDVEGLALTQGANGSGLLLVSDQGRNRFVTYQRQAPHQFAGEFMIRRSLTDRRHRGLRFESWPQVSRRPFCVPYRPKPSLGAADALESDRKTPVANTCGELASKVATTVSRLQDHRLEAYATWTPRSQAPAWERTSSKLRFADCDRALFRKTAI